jgi:hypothetical protein
MSFVSIDTILETVIHSTYDAAVDYLALWAEAFHKALP